ncbi:uncharacterized protein LACBIDRAFT_332369 [Laccaria bicolor S238N-H82]|uniref:Predicted protein n=1 Tax=Laccaria bicolor (strain S238N-H82 / ATCC MYA-4686) TaxID=486041 RepID=B0DSI4_LACBS|nr:uncharacterized protein LACBIDRAFT_332369 [Laccaria bicolor S238N-H82]EDR02553.1 predicted protein [Laccaria bicolor S238N-H82]|eukprot:XP_001886916.1 predicted protein [Laccaria bicolor S238N-H82]
MFCYLISWPSRRKNLVKEVWGTSASFIEAVRILEGISEVLLFDVVSGVMTSHFTVNYANTLRLYNAGKFDDGVRWGMLFEVGADYAAMLVPVPFRAGVAEPSSVDDLFTSYWVHSKSDDDFWENLGRYKLRVEVGEGDNLEVFSVHFSDQTAGFPHNYGLQEIGRDHYSLWKGAVLVFRINAAGQPMNCAIDDFIHSGFILARL